MEKNIKKEKNVGLALGSGGALGLAHIGAMMALEEEHIPIDMISGSSMGSLVGGLYSCGITTKRMKQLSVSMTTREERKYLDLSLSKTGLLNGNKIERLIDMMTGGKNFAQLDIPFCAVTCCLEDNELVTLCSGNVSEAIRASIAIPGVFKPVVKDGKTYVDGAVLERVPVDSLINMGADYIIAIDVGYRGTKRESPKNMIELMTYSHESMQWQATKPRVSKANVNISIDTKGMPFMSFKKAAECIQKGYDQTKPLVQGIKDDLIALGII